MASKIKIQDKINEKVQDGIFTELLSRPGNKECADCKDKNPIWVSIDFGVFLCIRCSGNCNYEKCLTRKKGCHRSLGQHITRVRSIKLDYSFKLDQIEILSNVGNKIANEYYEANIPTYYKKISLHSSMDECTKYMNDKYIRKMFAPHGTKTPVQKYLEAKANGNLIKDNTPIIKDPKDMKKAYVSSIKIEANSTASTKLESFDILSGDDDGFTEFKSSQMVANDNESVDFTKLSINPKSGASQASEIAKTNNLDNFYSKDSNKKTDESNRYNFFFQQQEPKILPHSSGMEHLMKNYPTVYAYNANSNSPFNTHYINMQNQYQQNTMI